MPLNIVWTAGPLTTIWAAMALHAGLGAVRFNPGPLNYMHEG